MSKEILATDIDEVLFPFVQQFALWHNVEYGTEFNFEDFTDYEFEKVLGVSIPETVHRVHSFLSQEDGHVDIDPLPESQEAIARLSEDYQIAAITARHPQFKDPTKDYLERYFATISDLILIGHKETVSVLRTKAEVCREIGAFALVDDSVTHVAGCIEAGLEGVLFGDYPWTNYQAEHTGIVHVKDWPGAQEYFSGRG